MGRLSNAKKALKLALAKERYERAVCKEAAEKDRQRV